MSRVVSFGEIMLRLSAKTEIARCRSFDVCYGGTEANVLACLSGLGHETCYLTALPDNELGDAVKAHLCSFGIDCSQIVTGGSILGTYFVSDGGGSRGANVIYNRAHSEFTKLDEDAFDYDAVFAGAELFHISGISFALSESSRSLAFRLVREARARGVAVSFDFNYRAKLWSIEEAGRVFREVVPLVDIVLASPLDLSAFLQTDEEAFLKNYPCALLVLRSRIVESTARHSVGVRAFERISGKTNAAVCDRIFFPVREKIGGGDAFDGAFLHRCLQNPSDLKGAVNYAVAAFALKHTIAGDTFTGTEEDIIGYAKEIGVNL